MRRGAASAAVLALSLLCLPLSVRAEEDAPAAPASPGPGVLLADLPAQAREALSGTEAPQPGADHGAWLDAVLAAAGVRELDLGDVVVRCDPRWFATLSADEPRSPIVELRRWPGDTVVALYAVGRGRDSVAAGPPVPDSTFVLQPGEGPARRVWSGEVTTDGGLRPALWIEREIDEASARLGALVLPGDAGFGAAGIDGLTQEALAVFLRVQVRERGWKLRTGVAAGDSVRVPAAGQVPGDKDEESDPWQVARGPGFTIGLPPGVRASGFEAAVPLARSVAGAALWLRGRYRDTEGQPVAIGDGERFGYVARVEQPPKSWAAGERPPLGAPQAESVASRGFPLIEERSGARAARAERWREPGFDGDWLVFRLFFGDFGYEIGLPMLSGRRSPSLYWIAATWRPEGAAPAPPPVDPAERFGIRFEHLTRVQRQEHPWMEGYLAVPGLRAEVSRGWFPAAALRSADGYPVRFLDTLGRTRGRLTRVEQEEVGQLASRSGWREDDKPGRHRAARVLLDDTGRHLFVAEEGHAFLFEPEALVDADEAEAAEDDDGAQLWRLMMTSVRLSRAGS